MLMQRMVDNGFQMRVPDEEVLLWKSTDMYPWVGNVTTRDSTWAVIKVVSKSVIHTSTASPCHTSPGLMPTASESEIQLAMSSSIIARQITYEFGHGKLPGFEWPIATHYQSQRPTSTGRIDPCAMQDHWILHRMTGPCPMMDATKPGVIPASLVILFAVSVTKVKCILRSQVLLECQVILGVNEVKLQSEVKWNITIAFNRDWTRLSMAEPIEVYKRALYHCAIEALLYLANLCYIWHLWPN